MDILSERNIYWEPGQIITVNLVIGRPIQTQTETSYGGEQAIPRGTDANTSEHN